MPVRSLAMPAPLRLPVSAPPEHLQVAQRAVADHDHVSAPTAVAAIWTAAGHVGLTPKRHGAVSACARLHVYARPVLKHRLTMAGYRQSS